MENMIICLFVIFIIMPVLTLLFAFIPKKYLPIKWNLVTGLALSNFLWILFMFIGIASADSKSSMKEQKFLDKHKWIIEELNKQKKQYSHFPANLSDSKIKPENDGIYNYEVKNSGKDFILYFHPYQSSKVAYVYCSSNVDKRCEANSDTYTTGKKLENGWIRTEFKDD